MPLKQGSTSVVRLYKRDVNLKYVYYGTSLPPGELAMVSPSNPEGQACSIAGEWLSYNPGAGSRYYRCQEVVGAQTEVTVLRDNLNRAIHKRVTISFNANGGSGSSSQTRTWGVEQTTQPSSPTRSGYDFQGWATTSSAPSPNVTFPRATPENNITYYAVWKKQQVNQLKWKYNKKVNTICRCEGYSLIGTACSVEGQTTVRCGSDEGYSGSCVELICAKV